MPGLSLRYNYTSAATRRDLDETLDALLHMPSYSKRILIEDGTYFLVCTGYPEYPIQLLDLQNRTVVVEGRILGKPESAKNSIEQVASMVFDSECGTDKLARWIQETDGEFLIFVLNRDTGEIAMLCDALGRLPCYFSDQNESLLVSREYRFITKQLNRYEYDRIAFTESLLFGYTLGDRTLLEGVRRLPPAFFLRVSREGTKLSKLHTFNFDSKENANRTADENAHELARLFTESCHQRAGDSARSVVSMSGGMDSRTVAAGLRKAGDEFVAATFGVPMRELSREAKIASELAHSLGSDWELYQLNPPTGADILELLKFKCGHNSLAMSFIVPFLHSLVAKYGHGLVYFTGDGGDKILPDMRPRPQLTTIEQLVAFILHAFQVASVKQATSLTGVESGEIENEVEQLVRSYPERDINQKCVHFIFHNHCMKYLYEGEDRNRFYFWSSAPFYGLPFFTYAMNCPDDQKHSYLLYRKFLANLSQAATHIPDMKAHLTPASRWFGPARELRITLDQRLPLNAKNYLRKIGPSDPQSPYMKCLSDQIRDSPVLREYLNKERLVHIADNSSRLTRSELVQLFTLTSFVELSNQPSSLSNYAQIPFR